MSFKENLKSYLNYKGIMVKELAIESGVNRRTLDNYLREKESQPTAENAVKIANALGVTVEFLVTGDDSTKKTAPSKLMPNLDLGLCKKYYEIIKKMDKFPDALRNSVCQMIDQIESSINKRQ